MSSSTAPSVPGLNAGLPRYGHDAQRKASPLKQLPHSDFTGCAGAFAASAFSSSFRPQEQLAQARFFVAHPPAAAEAAVVGSASAVRSASSSTVSPFTLPATEAERSQLFEGALEGAATPAFRRRERLALAPASHVGVSALIRTAGEPPTVVCCAAAALTHPERVKANCAASPSDGDPPIITSTMRPPRFNMDRMAGRCESRLRGWGK